MKIIKTIIPILTGKTSLQRAMQPEKGVRLPDADAGPDAGETGVLSC
jgi:hypothetical protein